MGISPPERCLCADRFCADGKGQCVRLDLRLNVCDVVKVGGVGGAYLGKVYVDKGCEGHGDLGGGVSVHDDIVHIVDGEELGGEFVSGHNGADGELTVLIGDDGDVEFPSEVCAAGVHDHRTVGDLGVDVEVCTGAGENGVDPVHLRVCLHEHKVFCVDLIAGKGVVAGICECDSGHRGNSKEQKDDGDSYLLLPVSLGIIVGVIHSISVTK